MPEPARTVATDLASRPGPGLKAKRAAVLADRIVEDVMSMGWPVGEVLGAEADLLERYGVSRAVFREAVRLVEHQEVARTRRGPGGGLVITEPTVEAVIDAVVLYLHRVDARLDEVFEARIVLEQISCELAAGRLEAEELDSLRRFAGDDATEQGSDPRVLHRLIAAAGRNPALILFVEVVNRVATMYSTNWKTVGNVKEMAHAHSRIAQAVIDGDAATARRRMRIHLEAEADYLRRRRTTRQVLPQSILAEAGGTGKMAEGVARSLALTVAAKSLRPGELIGTESELIEREKVSRAVLREAVRLLEYHQIARMRRGPGGGLFVVEPGTTGVTDVAAIYLARQKMTLAQLSELRTGVEVAIAELAAERIDPAGLSRLHDVLRREAEQTEQQHSFASMDLHAVLAALAGNRVLELVALVLIRLSRLHQIERLGPADREWVRSEVLRAHSGIASAVGAGDRDLARRRMQLHLDALAAVVR